MTWGYMSADSFRLGFSIRYEPTVPGDFAKVTKKWHTEENHFSFSVTYSCQTWENRVATISICIFISGLFHYVVSRGIFSRALNFAVVCCSGSLYSQYKQCLRHVLLK